MIVRSRSRVIRPTHLHPRHCGAERESCSAKQVESRLFQHPARCLIRRCNAVVPSQKRAQVRRNGSSRECRIPAPGRRFSGQVCREGTFAVRPARLRSQASRRNRARNRASTPNVLEAAEACDGARGPRCLPRRRHLLVWHQPRFDHSGHAARRAIDLARRACRRRSTAANGISISR